MSQTTNCTVHQVVTILAIEITQSCKPSWILCTSFTVVSCIPNVVVQTTHQPVNLASCAPAGKQVGHRLMAAGYRTVVH